MDEHGYAAASPASDGAEPQRASPWSNSPRATSCAPSHDLPKQGPGDPWQLAMNYAQDLRVIRHGALADSAMEFSSPAPRPDPVEPAVA